MSAASTSSNSQTALVLSGGGARGAYQVGVLKGVEEILRSVNYKEDNPFRILSGVSAGAINASSIASSDQDLATTISKMVYLWTHIKPSDIFSVKLVSFGKLTKVFSGVENFNSILDTTPLSQVLDKYINFSQIEKNIQSKKYESVIITANDYSSNRAVSFFTTNAKLTKKQLGWPDSRRQPKETIIQRDHIMGSAAIPFLFPPVEINGDLYGDGCVRNNTPCSPSIRLGAKKLFVIGVRAQQYVEKNEEIAADESADKKTPSSVSMLRIMNTLLNSILLDSVEQDVRRMLRINELIRKSKLKNDDIPADMQEIPAICISPSQNFGVLARNYAHKLPRLLRSTLKMFGSLDDANEILSYLMFDGEYCSKLIEIGYKDALKSKKEIINFFEQ